MAIYARQRPEQAKMYTKSRQSKADEVSDKPADANFEAVIEDVC